MKKQFFNITFFITLILLGFNRSFTAVHSQPFMAINTIEQQDVVWQVEAAEPIDESTPGRAPSPLSVVIWLLVAALAVLILLGIYYWWFQGKTSDEPVRSVPGVGILNPEKQAVFCHECGMRSRPGDYYCSNCGTELRRLSRQNTQD